MKMFLQRRILFLAGGLAAILVTALALGGQTVPPAAAPAAAPAPAVGRYQISAVSRNNAAQVSAYIIDTQTGEVFIVNDKQPPESIGSAAKPGQRK